MWRLLTWSMDIVTRRAQLDEEFASGLGTWSPLVEESRYARWLDQAQSIELDDHLQRELLTDTYNHHAFLFWPIFPEVSEPIVRDIALSGRIYADHLILIDHIADRDQVGTAHAIAQLKASFLLQHSLSLLCAHFPADSPFWHEFHTHQCSFAQAVLLEEAIHANKAGPTHDHATFEQIARGKSAMAKCTLAALAVAAGATDRLDKLYHLFDEVAVAAQIYDDFCDWKDDLRKGQISYLLSSFLSEIGANGHEQELLADFKELRRRFYLSEALRSAIVEAETRLTDHVLAAPEFANCQDWLKVIDRYRAWCAYIASQIVIMHERAKALQAVSPADDPVKRGVHFLLASQQPAGAWSDFYTTADESTDWVTGYVAQVIRDLDAGQEAVNHAASWLLKQRFPEGGWGYHRGVVQDADSTAACLRFMVDRLSPAEVNRTLRALQSFQRPDGGFSTYGSATTIAPVMNLDDAADFSGWCNAQPCVTAAAVLALCACHPTAECADTVVAALKYLLDTQRPDGAWNAYWWQGDIYATSMAIQAMWQAAGTGFESDRILAARSRGLGLFVETQHATGGWGAFPDGQDCPFQTALALLVLSCDLTLALMPAAQAAARYLLAAQQVNGCWRAAGPIMRLPRPDDLKPWEWPHDIGRGITLGTLVCDQHHLFTTATVVSALSRTQMQGVW